MSSLSKTTIAVGAVAVGLLASSTFAEAKTKLCACAAKAAAHKGTKKLPSAANTQEQPRAPVNGGPAPDLATDVANFRKAIVGPKGDQSPVLYRDWGLLTPSTVTYLAAGQDKAWKQFQNQVDGDVSVTQHLAIDTKTGASLAEVVVPLAGSVVSGGATVWAAQIYGKDGIKAAKDYAAGLAAVQPASTQISLNGGNSSSAGGSATAAPSVTSSFAPTSTVAPTISSSFAPTSTVAPTISPTITGLGGTGGTALSTAAAKGGAGGAGGALNGSGNTSTANTRNITNQQQYTLNQCTQNNTGSLGAAGRNGSGSPTQGCPGATVAGPYAGQINASSGGAVSPGTDSSAKGATGISASSQLQGQVQTPFNFEDKRPQVRVIFDRTRQTASVIVKARAYTFG